MKALEAEKEACLLFLDAGTLKLLSFFWFRFNGCGNIDGETSGEVDELFPLLPASLFFVFLFLLTFLAYFVEGVDSFEVPVLSATLAAFRSSAVVFARGLLGVGKMVALFPLTFIMLSLMAASAFKASELLSLPGETELLRLLSRDPSLFFDTSVGCSLYWCRNTRSLLAKHLPQNTHKNGFSLVCALWCRFKCSSRTNPRVHIGQRCGLGLSVFIVLDFLGMGAKLAPLSTGTEPTDIITVQCVVYFICPYSFLYNGFLDTIKREIFNSVIVFFLVVVDIPAYIVGLVLSFERYMKVCRAISI